MANRNLSNRIFSATRDRKIVDARVSFGASGAPTLDTTKSNGIISVTRDAQGKFTFVFGSVNNGRNVLDPYFRICNMRVVFNTAGVGTAALAAAPIMQIISNDTADSTKASVQVLLTCLDTPAATDPASGEVGHFTFEFGDGS